MSSQNVSCHFLEFPASTSSDTGYTDHGEDTVTWPWIVVGIVFWIFITLCMLRGHEKKARARAEQQKQMELANQQSQQEQQPSTKGPLFTEGVDNGIPDDDQLPSYNDTANALSAAPPAYGVTGGYGVDGAATGYSEGTMMSNPVKAFLMEIGRDFCSEYYQLFMNQGFDSMELMRTLSEEDLKEIGIDKLGHRRKIMMALTALDP